MKLATQRVWLKEKCMDTGQNRSIFARPCGGNLYIEQDGWGRWTKKCLLCSRAVVLSEDEAVQLRGAA